MPYTALRLQAEFILTDISPAHQAVEILLPLWLKFVAYLEVHNIQVHSVDEITADILGTYTQHIASQALHVDDALIRLAAVRLILARIDVDPKILGVLVIPRIRRRTKGRNFASFYRHDYRSPRDKGTCALSTDEPEPGEQLQGGHIPSLTTSI